MPTEKTKITEIQEVSADCLIAGSLPESLFVQQIDFSSKTKYDWTKNRMLNERTLGSFVQNKTCITIIVRESYEYAAKI